MIGDKRVLGLIPARSGSKGVPNKNTTSVAGKPLIAWTIEAGQQSKYLDSLVVSTDGEAIADVARAWGAQAPFLRPAPLAADEAASIDVVEHALRWLQEQGETFDLVVMLEPTSPLRESTDIDRALEDLIDGGARSIVSVCRSEAGHPVFSYRLSDARLLDPYLGTQPDGVRRQDIDDIYFLDGSVYASYTDTLMERRSFYHDSTLAYVVPRWKSIEIDEDLDIVLAEAVLRSKGLADEL